MAEKKKPGVMLYFDVRPCLNRLTDAEQAQLFRGILDYGESGIDPGFENRLGLVWDFVKPMIDRDADRYKEIQEKRAMAGSRGGQMKASKSKQNETNQANASLASDDVAKESNDSKIKQIKPSTTTTTSTTTATTTTTLDCIGAESCPTTTRQRFTPPSVEDVRVYAIEKGLSINPEAFVDYYTANGWKVGKNSMRDWKAAVRTWTRKDKENGRTSNCNRDTGTLEKPSIKLRAEYEL